MGKCVQAENKCPLYFSSEVGCVFFKDGDCYVHHSGLEPFMIMSMVTIGLKKRLDNMAKEIEQKDNEIKRLKAQDIILKSIIKYHRERELINIWRK